MPCRLRYAAGRNCLERFQSHRADNTISIRKITKGNNSAINVGGVTVVYLCTSSGHALYFYQVLSGWSGGAMVLGKPPVPERPTILITVGKGLLRLR